jgi:hypothetical protein
MALGIKDTRLAYDAADALDSTESRVEELERLLLRLLSVVEFYHGPNVPPSGYIPPDPYPQAEVDRAKEVLGLSGVAQGQAFAPETQETTA